MRLLLGTRGSALAVTQSELVADQLRARGHEVELVRIKTTGDVTTGSLTRLGTLGVFAAELRQAILDGRCDFAVHSMKDLPTAAVEGLTIAAVPPREDARDALCAGGHRLADLPPGATVGTGSPRRVAQLRALRPDLTYVDIRGNVGTRLARVADGDLDAVVLAAAGLRRLGLTHEIDELLPIIPAPGQGALALECRAGDGDVIGALTALDDASVRGAVEAERAVLAGLGGGCAAPIACFSDGTRLTAGVFALDSIASVVADVPLGAGAADVCLADLLAKGAADLADLPASRPSRLTNLHDDTSLWGGEVPLAGIRVLLPRADGALAEGLRAAGAEVTCCPVQRPVPLPQAGTLAGADWVVVTSATTVAMLPELGLAIGAGSRVAAVGPATAAALRADGHTVDLQPEGESSAAALAAAFGAGAGRVVIPGSALSSPVLAEGLRALGYSVETLPIYTMTTIDAVPAGVLADWRAGHFDVVVVTSGSVGAAFAELFGWRDETPVVAFGPPSRQWLEAEGRPAAAVAATQDADGLASAVAEAARSAGA